MTKINAIYILFLLFIMLFLACGTVFFSQEKATFELISKTKNFIAGNAIDLKFRSNYENEKPQLLIIHSYGKTVLDSKFEKGNYIFKIPKSYGQKSGEVSWYLINKNENITLGKFDIMPHPKIKTNIENYLGPRSILAGGKEFTMMVVAPTDIFDNPKNDNTKIILRYQFFEKITTLQLPLKNFIAWHEIYSPSKSGKLLISSECDKITSKEIEAEIHPNIATNFAIYFTRNHEFADGNQITTLKTSTIKDQFGNTISDGTLVTFIIKTKQNFVLKTFGTTINGMASAQILHPDQQEIYSVKGLITGIAESNTLTINYKPILSTFNYSFSNLNRTLSVGPIKSYMNQLVPDGIKVIVRVFHQNKLVATLQEDTSNGMVTFEFSKDFYKEKNYRFEISTLGSIKKTENLNYEHHQ